MKNNAITFPQALEDYPKLTLEYDEDHALTRRDQHIAFWHKATFDIDNHDLNRQCIAAATFVPWLHYHRARNDISSYKVGASLQKRSTLNSIIYANANIENMERAILALSKKTSWLKGAIDALETVGNPREREIGRVLVTASSYLVDKAPAIEDSPDGGISIDHNLLTKTVTVVLERDTILLASLTRGRDVRAIVDFDNTNIQRITEIYIGELRS